MKTILLTGVAGFIGARTAEFLLRDEEIIVVGVDNLNDYYDLSLKKRRLQDLQKLARFTFYPIDIEDLSSLQSLFKQYDFSAVLNLAARAGVRYSMENPYIYMTSNMNGSLNLLECMRSSSCKKYVLASTSSLYAGQKMPFIETLPVNEPISPYAASKKAAEVLAYTYHKQFDIDVSIIRYFTVYGPSGRPDMSIFRFIKWIDEGLAIQVYGDGSQARDFTYVDDIAQGTILAMKPMGYEIINLGGGNKPISIKRIIKNLEALLAKKAVVEYHEFHKADMKETWADIDKAKKILNWQPSTSLEQGLENTVIWHQKNRSLVNKIKL